MQGLQETRRLRRSPGGGLPILAMLLCACVAQAQDHRHAAAEERARATACAGDAAPTVHCGTTPTAAFDPSGKLWVAFAAGGHVYVSASTDRGGSFGPAVRVNEEAEALDVNGENRPMIAFGARGEIFVTWTKKLPGGYNGDIRFGRSVDGGASFAAPVTLNDDGLVTGHRFESLHVDGAGDVYVVWLDKRDLEAPGGAPLHVVGAAVYYTVSTDGGRSFAPNRRVAAESCECCRIAIAEHARGAAILWRHVFDESIRDHAFAVLGRDGVAVPARRATHDDWRIDACPHHGPAMIPAGDGAYHIAWFTAAPERKGLYYGRYSPAEGELRHLASVAPRAGAGHPHLASAGGRVVLAWKEFDGVRTSVNAIVSSDGGATWSAERAVAHTAGASDHPFLLGRDGEVFLSWHTEAEGFRVVPLGTAAPAQDGGDRS